MNDTLPPELAAFASLLDAHLCLRHRCRQPPHVRDAFHYCLCLLMVQAGKMRLEKKVPGESGVACVFATGGNRFSVVEPKMSKESKAALIDVLRDILEEEG